ncbi:MAG: hypothetical protein M4579_003828 [Chaenotheca gracillima]|nr:MAG: hypothetical protein M4579_003828 [Chaenotheca gracillima]
MSRSQGQRPIIAEQQDTGVDESERAASGPVQGEERDYTRHQEQRLGGEADVDETPTETRPNVSKNSGTSDEKQLTASGVYNKMARMIVSSCVLSKVDVGLEPNARAGFIERKEPEVELPEDQGEKKRMLMF